MEMNCVLKPFGKSSFCQLGKCVLDVTLFLLLPGIGGMFKRSKIVVLIKDIEVTPWSPLTTEVHRTVYYNI